MTEPTHPADEPLAERLRAALRDPAPPAEVLARAIAIGSPTRVLAHRTAGALRRVVAQLVDELGDFSPAWGVRSGHGQGRHALFRAEAVEIDVHVVPAGGGWAIAGQVFGSAQARRAVLYGTAGEFGAELPETGEFRFEGLPAGRYDLTVELAEVEVVVPALQVGPVPGP